MREYDQPFRDKLADEVEAAPKSRVWPQFVLDGVALRDAVRACKGE